ncbi:putative protein K02A2.6, partial [Mucuna pruriens]
MRSDEGDDLEEVELEDLEKLLEQERPRLQSGAEEIVVVNVGEEGEVKEIWVGRLMSTGLKQRLIKLLKEYVDIFAWSYRDMLGLDTTIIEHRDLNRASPKDNFPLPHIDMLMDNTTQHAFYSFMDGFSGYNQIRMVEEDREKTTFITTWGTFCYKNAGAIYQRAMVALFHDMMHKEVKVYVDDMIAKSKMPGQHLEDLRKLFERLRKYRLKLNPTKCIFRVKIGKLLGFIVNQRGIKLDPDKLTATCSPIFKLLQKNQKMEWDQKCQNAFEKLEEEQVDGKPWYHDIWEYLREGVHPPRATENDKRTLRRLAAGFFLSCMDDQEAQEIMEEVHEGTFDTHANGHALAHKILRVGYYWTKMESDYCQHVRRCMKCQVYVDNIHVALCVLHNLTSLWSFSMWGLDTIGPIEPKASNRHRFILVAIDYFTKWVEASSHASVTKSIVVKFIKKDIICRYGLPTHIITNNGTNLNNKMMTELCEQFKIKHHNSTPYHSKMNGAMEATNKNIKKIVQKMVLPYALHGYRTSIRTSMGATPYSLVYGTEVVLPVEVEIPSLRVLAKVELDDAEWI